MRLSQIDLQSLTVLFLGCLMRLYNSHVSINIFWKPVNLTFNTHDWPAVSPGGRLKVLSILQHQFFEWAGSDCLSTGTFTFYSLAHRDFFLGNNTSHNLSVLRHRRRKLHGSTKAPPPHVNQWGLYLLRPPHTAQTQTNSRLPLSVGSRLTRSGENLHWTRANCCAAQ